MKSLLFILLVTLSFAAKSQKVDSIYFNLYTDSIKKGVYNYINVDGKMTTGAFLPLMSDEVQLTSSAGKWEGNSIFIEQTSKVDSVEIVAVLKSRPEVKKSVIIYVKKIEVEPPLKTEEELMNKWGKRKGKTRN